MLIGSTFFCDSSSSSDCSNEIVVCDNNSNCNVTCHGSRSCQDSAFNGQYARSLRIDTENNWAMRFSTIYFPNNLLTSRSQTDSYSVINSQFRGQLICGSETYQCQDNNFIANYIDSVKIECQGTTCEGNTYQLSHVCFAELLNAETENLNQCEAPIYLFTMIDVIYLDSAQWWCICENFNNVYVEINSSLVVVNHIVQALDDIKQCFNYQNGSMNIIDYNPNNMDPDEFLDIDSVMNNCEYLYSGDTYNQTSPPLTTTIESMQTQMNNSHTSIVIPTMVLTVATTRQNTIANVASKSNDNVSNNTLLIVLIIVSVLLFGLLVSIFVMMYQMRKIKSINTEQNFNISAVNAHAEKNVIPINKIQNAEHNEHLSIGKIQIVIDEKKYDEDYNKVVTCDRQGKSKNKTKTNTKTKTKSKCDGSKQQIKYNIDSDHDDRNSQPSVNKSSESDDSDDLFGSKPTEGKTQIVTDPAGTDCA